MLKRLFEKVIGKAPEHPLFTGRELRRIIWPLVMEQLLSITIGMADSMMVTSVSPAALSGVSLVDSINVVLIQLFTALATGGAVVASQYLGKGDRAKARDSGRQLYVLCTLTAGVIGAVAAVLHTPLLRLIYGQIEQDVMESAQIYFLITALSYPFLGMYNSGSALFRAMGNTRYTLITSIMMNMINVSGNAITIYGFGMGAAGAAVSTLLSRIAGCVVITALLRNPHHSLCVRSYSPRLSWDMVKRILRIGVPSGFESSMFSFGKLLVASLVSSLGTAAIAANAVGYNFVMIQNVPGMSINLAVVTVVGRAMGAGQHSEARRYTRLLLAVIYICNFITTIPMIIFAEPLVRMFQLSEESIASAVWILVFHGSWAMITWPTAFTLPNTLHASGDVRYTMIVSTVTMWLCRVLLSYVLAWFGLGLKSVWIAMITDWAVRTAFYVTRYRGDKWLQKKVV